VQQNTRSTIFLHRLLITLIKFVILSFS